MKDVYDLNILKQLLCKLIILLNTPYFSILCVNLCVN